MCASIAFSEQLGILTTNMLSEVMLCCSDKESPNKLINKWRFGDVRFAYNFAFRKSWAEEYRKYCSIIAMCPKSPYKFAVGWFDEYPNVGYIDANDRPYFLLGELRDYTTTPTNQVLAFIYCDRSSVIYEQFLTFYDIKKLSYKEIQNKYANQCWNTKIYSENCFTNSYIDDQFVNIGLKKHGLSIVLRYNQDKCRGVLLMKPEFNPEISIKTKKKPQNLLSLDFSKLSEKFRWIPLHVISEMAQQRQESTTEQFKEQNDYLNKLGMKFNGFVNAPICVELEVPSRRYNYYSSDNQVATIISKEFGYREDFHSLILDITQIDSKAIIKLPYNLDIKPYLDKYPNHGILYEHIRHDNRARIIVQPYLASLYEDRKLTRILVCNHKSGPVDHGWSLVRKYYSHERMEQYFWPINKAYQPLEILQNDKTTSDRDQL